MECLFFVNDIKILGSASRPLRGKSGWEDTV